MVLSAERHLDDIILQVFEDADDQFYFPVTTQKQARDFVRALRSKGVKDDVICIAINEFEHNFSSWRKGISRQGIGNRVIERINRPVQELLLIDEEGQEVNGSVVLHFDGEAAGEDVSFSLSTPSKVTVAEDKDTKDKRAINGENRPEDNMRDKQQGTENAESRLSVVSDSKPIDDGHLNGLSNNEQQEKKDESDYEDNMHCTKPDHDENKVEDLKLSVAEKDPMTSVPPSKDKENEVGNFDTECSEQSKDQKVAGREDEGSPENDEPVQIEDSGDADGCKTIEPQNYAVLENERNETALGASQKDVPGLNNATELTTGQPEAEDELCLKHEEEQCQKTIQSGEDDATIDTKFVECENEDEKETADVNCVSAYNVGENFDSECEVDEAQLEDSLPKRRVPLEGVGFVYAFTDSAKDAEVLRVKVASSRQPHRRLLQAACFNLDIRLVSAVAVSSRLAACEAVRMRLKDLALPDTADWFQGSVEEIMKALMDGTRQYVDDVAAD